MSTPEEGDLVFVPAVVVEEGSEDDYSPNPILLAVMYKGKTFDIELPIELKECLLKTPEEVRLYSLKAMEAAIRELSDRLEFVQQNYRDLCGEAKSGA